MTPKETILFGGIKALEDDIKAELKNPGHSIEKLLEAYLRSIERTVRRFEEIKDAPEITHTNSHGLIKDEPSETYFGLCGDCGVPRNVRVSHKGQEDQLYLCENCHPLWGIE